METKRQKQLASDIQRIVSQVLQQEAREHLEGAFVTVSSVSLTPDLLEARINLSVLQEEKKQAVIQNLKKNSNVIRRVLGNQLKNKVRRIPELSIYLDESLDKVYEIERLLRESNTTIEEE